MAALHYLQKALPKKQAKGSYQLLSLGQRLGLAVGILVLAFVARTLSANLLAGTATSDYLRTVFSGSSLTLPLLLAVMIFGAVETFERAGMVALKTRSLKPLEGFFSIGFSLIIIYHFLWLTYTLNLYR